MHEPDTHALDLELMRLAHALIDVELVLVAVEALVSITERGDNRRDHRELIEHAGHVNIAGMHHEIDAAKNLEHRGRKMLAGFGDVGVGNDPDSHGIPPLMSSKCEPSSYH